MTSVSPLFKTRSKRSGGGEIRLHGKLLRFALLYSQSPLKHTASRATRVHLEVCAQKLRFRGQTMNDDHTADRSRAPGPCLATQLMRVCTQSARVGQLIIESGGVFSFITAPGGRFGRNLGLSR